MSHVERDNSAGAAAAEEAPRFCLVGQENPYPAE
jgi:hypothetical protein